MEKRDFKKEKNHEEILKNNLNRSDLYKKILEEKGQRNQLNQLMEECAEVIHAVSKILRGKDALFSIIEEVGDLEIMIEQIKDMFSIHAEIEDAKMHKLKIIKDKLEKHIL